ncbi:MAG TPA: chromate transporter [Nitrospiraceae bacterium]|nr:chromate transporter [Nitrospiraceae bacterium]
MPKAAGETEEQSAEQAGSSRERASLWSLSWTFLKIGSTAFGGFMALISVVQNYVVERKKLMRHEDMLDGMSLATVLPGPVAVNVVAYVGYRIRGGLGALVCAVAVILPSFILLLGLSYAYFRFGNIPAVNKFFMGFIPAVSAIIVAAAWNMGKKTINGAPEALLAVAAAGLLIGVGGFPVTVSIIIGSGILGWLLFHRGSAKRDTGKEQEKDRKDREGKGPLLKDVASLPLAASFLSMNLAAAGKLFVTFAGMSVLLFGGGYVFIPLIQEIVVDGHGWVTQQEFIDAIALGQVTPGPILISATFIGYKVAGLIGATTATVGIFTPPALLMLLSTRFLDRIKQSDAIQASLRGIRSGVIGMIAAAAFVVGRTAEMNGISLLIFGVAVVALLRFKVEVVWIIPLAGITGLLLY